MVPAHARTDAPSGTGRRVRELLVLEPEEAGRAAASARRAARSKACVRRDLKRQRAVERPGGSVSDGAFWLRRRDLLKGAGALAGVALWGSGARARADRSPDVHLELAAASGDAAIWPGAATAVLRYSGRVVAGPSGALVTIAESYLGPVLRLRRGQRVRIDFYNRLDQPTNIHWHGVDTPADMDGHPCNVIPAGGTYRYEFEVLNPAGTYWYHPHPMGATARQVYAGLAGLLIVSDDDEGALMLPRDDRDLPIVVQDRLREGNQFFYPGEESFDGALGDQIVVNGLAARETRVAAAAYRLRILNGSNARIYSLAWSDGSPLTVIGTDGGLLSEPAERTAVLLSPGGRIEVWADFARWRGGEVWLESGAFGGGMGRGAMMRGSGIGMHGPAMGGHGHAMPGRAGGAPANGAPFAIQRFVVTASGAPSRVPALLAPSTQRLDEAPMRLRRLKLDFSGGRWLINGREFVCDEVLADEVVPFGAVEDWEFRSGHMMSVAHPMHLHGARFRVVGRSHGMHGCCSGGSHVDEGWKDTVLAMPGESVRVRIRFGHYRGRYVVHCHNLEHEEMGMMRNFLVR